MEPRTIRVLIANDEAVLRSALADLISSDDAFELVGAARNADEAIAMAEATKPDVAIVDVRMPGGGGLRVAEELRERAPGTRVIAHTAVDDRTTVVRMRRGGAVGYLAKGTAPSDIIDAIRGASRGQPIASSDVMSALVKDLATRLEHEEIATSAQRARIDLITLANEGAGRSMAFQPIVELERQTLQGLEALARFDGERDWPGPPVVLRGRRRGARRRARAGVHPRCVRPDGPAPDGHLPVGQRLAQHRGFVGPVGPP